MPINRTSGLAITELLIASFLLGVATIAITGLAVSGTRMSLESERKTIALAFVNERAEFVRSLPYLEVNIAPEGQLSSSETVPRNQQSYVVDTTVELIDDAINGMVPAGGLNERTADYKRVTIRASWESAGGNDQSVHVVEYVAPSGSLELCTPGDLFGCRGMVSPGKGACVPRISCPLSGVCSGTLQPAPLCPGGVLYCPNCYTDNDCSVNETCNTTTKSCQATPGACRDSSQCPGSQVCSDNRCTPRCINNSNCSGGKICNVSTGICTQPCAGTSCNCPESFTCNETTNLCDDPGGPPLPSPSPPLPSVSPPPPPAGSPPTCPTAPICSQEFAYWKFDGHIGSLVCDRSGNGRHATHPGAFGMGDNYQPMTYPASSEFAYFTDGTPLTQLPRMANNPFSISFWFLVQAVLPSFTSHTGTLVSDSVTSAKMDFTYDTSNSLVRITIRRGGGEDSIVFTHDPPSFSKVWRHVVMTQSGNTVRLFIDNVSAVPAPDNQIPWSFTFDKLGSGPTIGSGYIDEVRVYNRVLTGLEILQLYTASVECLP